MSTYYDHLVTVASTEVDAFGCCRASALLAYMQEAGNFASQALHISREELLAHYNAFWMLARVLVRMREPLRAGDALTVRTWHRGNKGAVMYRDFDFIRNGKPVGEAVSAWVLADWSTHKLMRLSVLTECGDTTGGALCKSEKLRRVKLPEALSPAYERVFRYSDLDVNGHVNNTKYADYVCDALPEGTFSAGRFLAELQIGYEAECAPGDRVTLCLAPMDGGFGVRGQDGDGVSRFEAYAKFGDIPTSSDQEGQV